MNQFPPVITGLIVLCASALAFATPSPHGSTVLVPPLASKAPSKSSLSIRITLPTQAGNVSKMVTTNLVAKGPSWIAKGDKYYSLCVPNRRMVACAPIVATSVMEGIEVGALAGTKGEPLITFKLDITRLTPKRAVYAINYFLARTNKQVAHFNRMAVAYAPTPQQNGLRVGPTNNVVGAGGVGGTGGGGNCSYGDEGSYDCTGGNYEGTGGSYERDDPIPNPAAGPDAGPITTPSEPTDSCQGNCNYPSGNNSGDPDPCIDPNGNRICNSAADVPQVPVPGQAPGGVEPMSMPTCRPTGPLSIECGRIPPVVGGEPQELQRGPTPWFPQTMCNTAPIFCSAGQEPRDNDRGDGAAGQSGKTLDWLYTNCNRIYEAECAVCTANKGAFREWSSLNNCYTEALARMSACNKTAERLTDNGEHLSP